MSTIIENIDLILDPTVLRASVGTAILGVALCVYLGAKPSGPSQWQIGQLSVRNYVLPLVIPACLGFIWVTVVNRFVPIPYMVS